MTQPFARLAVRVLPAGAMTGSLTACSDAGAYVCGAVKAGVLATLTMDTAMAAAGIVGGDAFSSPRLSLQMIGRWAGDLTCGNWSPEDMLSRPLGAAREPSGW